MRVDPSIPNIQVIIIANTRELIRQVQQVLAKVCQRTKVTTCIGDTSTPEQGANIVVTVPKWIENRLGGRKPIDLSHLKLVVYDEADEIFLQEANHVSIMKMKNQIEEKLKINPQTVLFSATFDDAVMKCINTFFTSVQVFRIQKEALKLKGVKMYRMTVAEKAKLDLINQVYLTFDMLQTMIFVNKKDDAVKMQEFLKKKNVKAEILIGGIEQAQRDKIIDDFRLQTITCLICTNVLARGIDVPEVDLVINYDVPYISNFGYKNPDYANFMHRVGRTGRFGTDGVSLTLQSDETYEDILDDIEKYYNISISKLD